MGSGDTAADPPARVARGILEALAFHWGAGQLADVFVWIFMIIVLLARPSGLFGSLLPKDIRA